MIFGILAFCFVPLGPLGLICLGLSLSIGHRWKYMWLLSLLFSVVFFVSFFLMGSQTVLFLVLAAIASFGMGFTCPTRFNKRVRISLFVFALLVIALYLFVLWVVSNALADSGTTTV